METREIIPHVNAKLDLNIDILRNTNQVGLISTDIRILIILRIKTKHLHKLEMIV